MILKDSSHPSEEKETNDSKNNRSLTTEIERNSEMKKTPNILITVCMF